MFDKKIFYVEALDLRGLKEPPAKCAEVAKRKKKKGDKKKKRSPTCLEVALYSNGKGWEGIKVRGFT